jgi:hypothetical protein
MNAHDMIVDYLESHGYTGLVNQEIPCGCVAGDLAPCGGECMNLEECVAGYVHYCDDCSPANKEECTVEDCPCVGVYCVGPEKEITHHVEPPREPWITDAKLRDVVEFYVDLSLESKARGKVKIISSDHRSLRVLEEGMGMLARVTPETFIRIVKPVLDPDTKETPIEIKPKEKT